MANPRWLTSLAAGKGGRAKAAEVCEAHADKVLTGAFMVLGVDDREVTVSIRRKYISFIWVGPSVPAMMKAGVAAKSGKLKGKFDKVHVQLQIDEVSMLAEDKLEKEVSFCWGRKTCSWPGQGKKQRKM